VFPDPTPGRLTEMLHALRASVASGAWWDTDPLVEAIENLIEDEPEACRAVILGYDGDEMGRLWALGLVGDPADFDRIAAALGDPELRHAALEALGNQPDADRVDAVARSLLDDTDPRIRSRAAGMVAFRNRPDAIGALQPLTTDPDVAVRAALGWHLCRLGDPAEPTLRTLLDDPEEAVRMSAARGLARIDHARRRSLR
jgi:HEAT repeat protein